MTGSWSKTHAYTIPAPFSGPQKKGSWLCYAAKSHPGLAKPSGELIFSYICNSFCNASCTRKQEFQPGGMDMSERGYWFRFLRMPTAAAVGASASGAAASAAAAGRDLKKLKRMKQDDEALALSASGSIYGNVARPVDLHIGSLL